MEATGRLFPQSSEREQFILLLLCNPLNQWRASRNERREQLCY